MPKALPSNNMPWPENLIFDFSLPAETSPAEAEAFISSIETSDRNHQLLRLRYMEGKQYKEISEAFGITPSAVRMAVKYMREKHSSALQHSPSAAAATLQDVTETADESIPTTEDATELPIAASEPPVDEEAMEEEAAQRPELDPIITAIGTTTRQRTFVYDLKTRAVLPFDQVPRGLRKTNRYIALPDYYQIKEYDLMKEFVASLASPDKRSTLEAALGGVGPFKAFRSTVRSIGLGQAWADYRFAKFSTLAAEWWDANVSPQPLPLPAEEVPPDDGHAEEARLIVNPATLNGVALIETIRILFRRVGPQDFEEALDELRDAMCSVPFQNPDQRRSL